MVAFRFDPNRSANSPNEPPTSTKPTNFYSLTPGILINILAYPLTSI